MLFSATPTFGGVAYSVKVAEHEESERSQRGKKKKKRQRFHISSGSSAKLGRRRMPCEAFPRFLFAIRPCAPFFSSGDEASLTEIYHILYLLSTSLYTHYVMCRMHHPSHAQTIAPFYDLFIDIWP